MKKRFLALLLALCLVLSMGLPALAAASFSDVAESSWYYENVTRMADMKALNGYPNGTFGPGGNITNGEFITVLMRTLTGTEKYPATGAHWASGALSAAVESGVCAAGDIAEAELDTPITRAAAAKYTAHAVSGLLKEKAVDIEGISALIRDSEKVTASGCADEIIDMYARGIITGDEKRNFNPDKNITRAEAATIVLRAYDSDIRQLPFGVVDTIESVWPEYGVFFLYCCGGKYDVKSVEILAVSANGVSLSAEYIAGATAYNALIKSDPALTAQYADAPVPDAVLNIDWDINDLQSKAAATYHDDKTNMDYPVIDFTFELSLTLTDGSTVPYAFTASYYIDGYGGIL